MFLTGVALIIGVRLAARSTAGGDVPSGISSGARKANGRHGRTIASERAASTRRQRATVVRMSLRSVGLPLATNDRAAAARAIPQPMAAKPAPRFDPTDGCLETWMVSRAPVHTKPREADINSKRRTWARRCFTAPRASHSDVCIAVRAGGQRHHGGHLAGDLGRLFGTHSVEQAMIPLGPGAASRYRADGPVRQFWRPVEQIRRR